MNFNTFAVDITWMSPAERRFYRQFGRDIEQQLFLAQRQMTPLLALRVDTVAIGYIQLKREQARAQTSGNLVLPSTEHLSGALANLERALTTTPAASQWDPTCFRPIFSPMSAFLPKVKDEKGNRRRVVRAGELQEPSIPAASCEVDSSSDSNAQPTAPPVADEEQETTIELEPGWVSADTDISDAVQCSEAELSASTSPEEVEEAKATPTPAPPPPINPVHAVYRKYAALRRQRAHPAITAPHLSENPDEAMRQLREVARKYVANRQPPPLVLGPDNRPINFWEPPT